MKKQKNKKNYWHQTWTIISYILYGLVIIFAVSALLSKISIGGFKLLTVQSGSMAPTIKTGSLIVVKPEADYQKNDIVTFYPTPASKLTTTHRIVDVKTESGLTYYQTKGDANATPDSSLIGSQYIIGKTKITVSYLGYPISFVKTLPGLIILIIIPATIIVYDEINNIKTEIRKQKLKRKKQNKRQQALWLIKAKKFIKAWVKKSLATPSQGRGHAK